MYKNILHPTDFSPVAMQAFDQAVALALRYGAKLQILHAVVLHEYDLSLIEMGRKKLDDAYVSLREELRSQMEVMVEGSDIANDLCSLVTKRGLGAGEALLEWAEESKPDLIVMGTHGHASVRRFFLGSVAERVVRYAPCPVMVLGSMEDAPGRFKNILLPVDFSKASHAAADAAMGMAQAHKANVHILHVYQDLVPPVYYVVTTDAFEWDTDLKRRGEEALEKFISHHRREGVEIVPHLTEGRPARSIVELADEESMDLVVMGTAGLGGAHRFMVGSVTERVIRRSNIPVLTVKAGSAEEPDDEVA